MALPSSQTTLLLVAALIILTASACAAIGDREAPQRAAIVRQDTNVIAVTEGGSLDWNGQPVTLDELVQLLAQSMQLPTEPALSFEPSANTPYGFSVEVLQVIRESGVTKFGFTGNEKDPNASPLPD